MSIYRYRYIYNNAGTNNLIKHLIHYFIYTFNISMYIYIYIYTLHYNKSIYMYLYYFRYKY